MKLETITHLLKWYIISGSTVKNDFFGKVNTTEKNNNIIYMKKLVQARI